MFAIHYGTRVCESPPTHASMCPSTVGGANLGLGGPQAPPFLFSSPHFSSTHVTLLNEIDPGSPHLVTLPKPLPSPEGDPLYHPGAVLLKTSSGPQSLAPGRHHPLGGSMSLALSLRHGLAPSLQSPCSRHVRLWEARPRAERRDHPRAILSISVYTLTEPTALWL